MVNFFVYFYLKQKCITRELNIPKMQIFQGFLSSREQEVTNNKQKVKSNEEKVTSNEEKVTGNEEKVTSQK